MLFEGLAEYVDRVHDLPYWEGGAAAFFRALWSARLDRAYDAAFLAYPSARLLYRGLLSAFKARQRFAHDHGDGSSRMDWIAGITPVPVRAVHNVERNRDLLRAANIAPDDTDGYLVPPAWIEDRRDASSETIAIHIGSVTHDGLAAKRWPLEYFIRVCRDLVAEGRDVALIAGPEEALESDALQRAVPGVHRFEGDLPSVARFLSACAVLVANDNGIAHLAAGVGTRVIAVFGPTPVEGAPFSHLATVLRPSSCPPCFDVRKPVVTCVRNIDFACLKRDLTPELVVQSVRDAIRRAQIAAG